MRPIVALLAIMLAGCGASDNDTGPGGVTVGEARALDEAAAMVEERQLGRKPKAAATSAP